VRERGCWSTCLVYGVLALLLLVALPLVGFLVGGSLYSSRSIDHPSRWREIGMPPEGAREIVSGFDSWVTVRAPSGTYYTYRRDKVAEDGSLWHREGNDESMDDGYKVTVEPLGVVITPPGKIISQYDVTYRPIPESQTRTRWVITADGTLWRWQHVNDMYTNIMKLLAGPFVGLLLALVILVPAGIAMWVSLRRRTRAAVAATDGDDLLPASPTDPSDDF